MALFNKKPEMVEVPENFDIHFREMAEQCREQELMIEALESELEFLKDRISELSAVLRTFGYVSDEEAFTLRIVYGESNNDQAS